MLVASMRHLAAVRHGVAGIDREIDQRGFEVVGSTSICHSPAAPDRFNFDGLAQRALQEIGCARAGIC